MIDTCREWCRVRGVAPWAHLYRLVFAVMSESGGLVYANDGQAFHPDPAGRRPGWDKDDQGRPLPDDVIAACYRTLRVSLDYPHDSVGNNGGSCDMLQGLSDDYVSARFGPGRSFGWGTLAQRLDPKTGIEFCCQRFLEKLRITNDRMYRGLEFDPIAADVLRVQQPLVSESSPNGNYSPARVAAAKHIVDHWAPDYFTKGTT